MVSGLNLKPKGSRFKSPQQQKDFFRHCSRTVAHWLHCSAFDRRWPALTMWHFGKNRRFIAKIVDISWDIVDFWGFLLKFRWTDISPWNIVSIPSDTWYIADISRYFPSWTKVTMEMEMEMESRMIPKELKSHDFNSFLGSILIP